MSAEMDSKAGVKGQQKGLGQQKTQKRIGSLTVEQIQEDRITQVS